MDPYSIRTSDPMVKQAIDYLVSLGAPPNPELTDVEQPFPGGVSMVYSQVTFTDGVNVSSPNAGLLALFPNVAAGDLMHNHLLSLPTGFNPRMLAPYQIAEKFPMLAPIMISPIGPAQGDGSVGGSFYGSPSDHFPIGQTLVQNGQKFEKHGSVTPFGTSSWWVRVS